MNHNLSLCGHLLERRPVIGKGIILVKAGCRGLVNSGPACGNLAKGRHRVLGCIGRAGLLFSLCFRSCVRGRVGGTVVAWPQDFLVLHRDLVPVRFVAGSRLSGAGRKFRLTGRDVRLALREPAGRDLRLALRQSARRDLRPAWRDSRAGSAWWDGRALGKDRPNHERIPAFRVERGAGNRTLEGLVIQLTALMTGCTGLPRSTLRVFALHERGRLLTVVARFTSSHVYRILRGEKSFFK